jgi:hypothetical protein
MPTRLTRMVYDEVSLVDAGACADDREAADVVLFKRDSSVSADEIIDISKTFTAEGGAPGASSKKSSGKGKKKRGTSNRAAHWNESRHPRIKSGAGGGEFSSSSAQSKVKYGKGGTAKDNLPKNYQTSNKGAAGLQQGLTPAQQKIFNADAAKSGAASAKKAKSAKKAAAAHKRAVASHQASQRSHTASVINSMDATQRKAYRAAGRPIPKGYKWDYNNHLISAERAKMERGLPHDKKSKSSSKSGSSSSSAPQKRMELVMDAKGNISWKLVPVGEKNHGVLVGGSKTKKKKSKKNKARKKTAPPHRRRFGWKPGPNKREYVKKGARHTTLDSVLFAEGSTTS